MLKIETVNIDDVFAPEDEYGNKFLSRDYSTKENQEYIKKLADDIKSKGAPEEPVVLVEDGGTYIVKTGNTRVEAMRLNGVKKFEAVIDLDATPEDALRLAEAAYRTNLKKTYSPVEQAKISQQLFAFCPDDYKVADVMHDDPDNIKKMRRGYSLAKERGGSEVEQMTLDHFKAISDFEDDEDAIDKLMSSSEADVDRTYRYLCNQRTIKKNLDEIEAKLSDLGILIVNETPEGYRYECYFETVEEIESDEEFDPSVLDRTAWRAKKRIDDFAMYRKTDNDSKESKEKQAARIRKDKMERIKKSRCELFAHEFLNLPHYQEYTQGKQTQHYSPFYSRLDSFIDDLELTFEIDPIINMINVFCCEYDSLLDYSGNISSRTSAYYFIDTTAALVEDGYMPSEIELELVEEAKAFLNQHAEQDGAE